MERNLNSGRYLCLYSTDLAHRAISHLRLAVLKQALVRAAQGFVRDLAPQRRAQLVELLRRAPSYPPRPLRAATATVATAVVARS